MGRAPIDEVVIPLSKTKITLVILGSVAFVPVCVWIWSIAEAQDRFHPLYMKGVALACGFLCSIGAIYGCYMLLDRKPGLIIDSEGIVDNSSGIAVGRVFWGEIVGLKVTQVSGQRFLTVMVVDPKKYLHRGGLFLRMVQAANFRMMGSPINIASNALEIRFDDLVDAMNQAYAKISNG